MYSDTSESPTVHRKFAVILDGLPVALPAERQSLSAIRAFLEMMAMEHQKLLGSLYVDGQMVDLSERVSDPETFTLVEGETIELSELPLRLLIIAKHQVTQARTQVEEAVTRVLINDVAAARESWWSLVHLLKAPLLTLSLLPESQTGVVSASASQTQIRRWQLQQLATIIYSVDKAAAADDTVALSDALENRALPWLDKMHEIITLWHDTAAAGCRLGIPHGA